MRLPVLDGLIKRRLLVNFRIHPDVAQRLLPGPFRPKLQRGFAIGGICLIRLEQIRPRGFPSFVGLASENAAHRIAVEWLDGGRARQGVFIPRRDTGSFLNRLAGGRLFPGEHHAATFSIKDDGRTIDFSMNSHDGFSVVQLRAVNCDAFSSESCFGSLGESSQFFEGGSVGYSMSREPGRLDGLELTTREWIVRPVGVERVESNYFCDTTRFPPGTVEFDHALIMRDTQHSWRSIEDCYCEPGRVG